MNVLFQFDLSRIQPSTVYLDLAHLINQGGLQYSMSVLAAYLFRHSNLSQSESTLYSQLRKYKCICEWKYSIQCYTTVYNCIPVCPQSLGCGLFCVYLCRRKLISVYEKRNEEQKRLRNELASNSDTHTPDTPVFWNPSRTAHVYAVRDKL